jgi:hypothetical protein
MSRFPKYRSKHGTGIAVKYTLAMHQEDEVREKRKFEPDSAQSSGYQYQEQKKRSFERRDPPKVVSDDEVERNPMTIAREKAMKEKAKKKRDEEKHEKRRKEMRYNTLITSFAKKIVPCVDITDDNEKNFKLTTKSVIVEDQFPPVAVQSVILAIDNDGAEEVEVFEPAKVIEQKSVPSEIRVALVDDDGERISDASQLDWPELQMLQSLMRKIKLGCCGENDCTFNEHDHENDNTVLGLMRPPVIVKNGEVHRCTMPADPFDEKTFPLFKFLPEAFHRPQQQSRAKLHRKNAERRMSHSNSASALQYTGLMLRLRAKYFVELANVRSSYSQTCSDIDKRQEPNLIIAKVTNDEQYEEEIVQAVQRERETARNVFHARLDTLHQSMQKLVISTLVQCAASVEFRLPLPMTTKACLDTIRLPGGAEREEQFYANIFVDIARGSLDTLEAEKSLVSHDHDLSLDAYFGNYRNSLELPVPGTEPPNNVSTNNSTNNSKSRRAYFQDEDDNVDDKINGMNLDDDVEALLRGEDQEPPESPEHPTPPESPAPRKRKRSRWSQLNETVAADEEEAEEVESLRRVEYPCVSQGALGNAGHACTSIAFIVAMRLVTAHLLAVSETLGVTNCIFSIDYEKVLNNGAHIWRTWVENRQPKIDVKTREATALEQQYAALLATGASRVRSIEKELKKYSLDIRDLYSTFMHPPEVIETSDYVRKRMDSNNLTYYETGGYIAGSASEVTGEVNAELDEIAPSLEHALDTAAKLGVFAAVLTMGGSSICVAYTDDRWFLFDSHGLDRAGMSTLVSFATKQRLMDLIISSADASTLTENADETIRLEKGTYNLCVLHFKERPTDAK